MVRTIAFLIFALSASACFAGYQEKSSTVVTMDAYRAPDNSMGSNQERFIRYGYGSKEATKAEKAPPKDYTRVLVAGVNKDAIEKNELAVKALYEKNDAPRSEQPNNGINVYVNQPPQQLVSAKWSKEE